MTSKWLHFMLNLYRTPSERPSTESSLVSPRSNERLWLMSCPTCLLFLMSSGTARTYEPCDFKLSCMTELSFNILSRSWQLKNTWKAVKCRRTLKLFKWIPNTLFPPKTIDRRLNWFWCLQTAVGETRLIENSSKAPICDVPRLRFMSHICWVSKEFIRHCRLRVSKFINKWGIQKSHERKAIINDTLSTMRQVPCCHVVANEITRQV